MDGLHPDAHKVRVLAIDDVGNDKLTMNREVDFLRVIRNRCDWHQPMILTTQFRGADLANRFSEQSTAQAIVRRLREFSDVVNFDQFAGSDRDLRPE